MPSRIIDEIDRVRIRKGVSLSEIERRSGVKERTLKSWLNKERSPGLDKLLNVADCLGLKLKIVKK